MSITVVRTLPQEEWRRFVDEHPQSNIFHTPEMFEVFARAKGYSPTFWAAVDADQGPLALLLPVKVTVLDGLLRRFTTRAIAYGSVLCAQGSAGKSALATLLQVYKKDAKHSALFTELRNVPDLTRLQPVLNEQGFVFEDHLNYLIDLARPPEAIMQDIGRRTRKNLRRAMRRDEVVVEEANQREQVAHCIDLLERTYQAAQIPLADRSLFEAAFDVLHPKGMVKFLLVRVKDDYAASSLELVFKDTIYGWYGGMDREYSKYSPNELLLWRLFEWGSENGYEIYDFGGAGKPDEEYGVRDFKAKFGGDLVGYGRNTYVHRPVLLKLGEWAYAVYRKFL